MKGVCLLIAGILFLLLFFSFSGVKKTKLLDTDGRNFEKAEVTEVISGNLSNSGSGKQTVELKLLSGDHKGKTIQATSSQSYLFGAKCKKGMKVIAIVSESNGELLASVYSVNRGPMVWLMAAIFVANCDCSWRKKRNFINFKFDFYHALYLFYFPSNDLSRNITNSGSCIGGCIYNDCHDVYGGWNYKEVNIGNAWNDHRCRIFWSICINLWASDINYRL